MQTTKMSLANIQGKLSRAEMKNIMAGSGGGTGCGTGISCSGKKEKDTCGSRGTCQCYYNSSTDRTLYCQNQN